MKTFSKSKTVIAILLFAHFLYSCDDGLIEPHDTFSTESEEIFSRPDKGKSGGVVYYDVTINEGIMEAGPDLLLTGVSCVATNNSKQDLIWFDNGCETVFTTSGPNSTNLFLSSIRLGNDSGEYQVIMYDIDDNIYFCDFYGEDVLPLPALGYIDGINIDRDGLLIKKKVGKGKNVRWIDSGTIGIGQIVITPK